MGYFSKALAITATDTINMLPAWEFMNQTGTLGTNLRGSLIQIGTAGNINVIPNGKIGPFATVTALTLLTGGSGYVQNLAGAATTNSSIVPVSIGNAPSAGLTIDITVPVPTTNALAAGTGYPTGAFEVTGGTGTGLSGTIDSVTGGGATGPIATFTIIDGGQGYTAGNVLTIVSGDGIDGTITLATAPNGAVTVGAIRAAGERYSIGDVITINQAGSGLNATFRVDMVRGLAPVLSDGVLFTGLQAGDILPIYVDYVLATTTTAGALVAGRESSIG